MITLDQARGLLARAVLTQGPDFVYRTTGICAYQPTTQAVGTDEDAEGVSEAERDYYTAEKTGCLIGVALDLAGYTDHRSSAGSVVGLWSDRTIPGVSAQAVAYWQAAQSTQDGRLTWGEAYRRAEAIVGECAKLTETVTARDLDIVANGGCAPASKVLAAA